MAKKIKIAWDISHLEFTIEDHYYFSTLKSQIKEAGASVAEITSIKDAGGFDVLVLNYPEEPFNKTEVKLVKKYAEAGGKVIIAGYYNNEDRIADRINTLAEHFGLSLLGDKVRDKNANDQGDDLLPVTSRILSFSEGVERALFPCAGSVKVSSEGGKPLVSTESGTLIAAETPFGAGKFILLGTCVFWDNFAIRKYSNLRFSLNLLLG
ncbi:MAG: hypothetical protein ACT4NX_00745 [Deltaproteobacteria bacterium]